MKTFPSEPSPSEPLSNPPLSTATGTDKGPLDKGQLDKVRSRCSVALLCVLCVLCGSSLRAQPLGDVFSGGNNTLTGVNTLNNPANVLWGDGSHLTGVSGGSGIAPLNGFGTNETFVGTNYFGTNALMGLTSVLPDGSLLNTNLTDHTGWSITHGLFYGYGGSGLSWLTNLNTVTFSNLDVNGVLTTIDTRGFGRTNAITGNWFLHNSLLLTLGNALNTFVGNWGQGAGTGLVMTSAGSLQTNTLTVSTAATGGLRFNGSVVALLTDSTNAAAAATNGAASWPSDQASVNSTNGVTAAQAQSKLAVTGTQDGTHYLRDDWTWQVPSGGGGGGATLPQVTNAYAGMVLTTNIPGSNIVGGIIRTLVTNPTVGASTVWTMPTNCMTVHVILIGAGGGGAVGATETSGTASWGGGGGAGGNRAEAWIPAVILGAPGSTIVLTNGGGGPGGIGAGSAAPGTNSYFGTWLYAAGGGAGSHGSSSAGNGGAPGTGGGEPGGSGGNSSATGNPNTPQPPAFGGGAAGGGAGGGIATGGTGYQGAASGRSLMPYYTANIFGSSTSASSTSNGTSPTGPNAAIPYGANGGSGSGATTGTTGQTTGSGGNGAYPGGGGAGSGACNTGSTPGNGGNGANGYVLIEAFISQ